MTYWILLCGVVAGWHLRMAWVIVVATWRMHRTQLELARQQEQWRRRERPNNETFDQKNSAP